MADTLRERILAAIAGKLVTGAGGLTPSPSVERNRDGAINKRPALGLFDGDELVDDSIWGVDAYTLDFSVEGHVDGGEAAANELAGRVRPWLLADPTLGGLAIDLTLQAHSFMYTEGKGQKTVTGFRLSGQASYWTKPGDPFTAGP